MVSVSDWISLLGIGILEVASLLLVGIDKREDPFVSEKLIDGGSELLERDRRRWIDSDEDSNGSCPRFLRLFASSFVNSLSSAEEDGM